MSDNAFVAMLGPELKTQTGTSSTAEALSGAKAVGLYFSAHWCPPCRGFTPTFAAAYTDHLKAKGLEVVFVSSDKDESQFDGYFGEMPWLALPFGARDLKAKLSKKFKVSGIPSLVILDGATGETITTDGREAIGEDPQGKEFPWKPPSFWDALGDDFLSKDPDESVTADDIKQKKVIGLYFSAHWCPPCRGFTPSLIKAYNEHLQAKGLEIVFVSSDRDQAAFNSYYDEMPWLAIPPGDPRKAKLSQKFGVSGIPALVLVDAATGETITDNARGSVSADPTGVDFPWHPKPLKNMAAGEGLDQINEETALCVMLEGCDQSTKDAAMAVLTPLAEARKAAGDDILFFHAPAVEGPTEQIRKLTKIGEPTASPQLVLLDIPDEGGFYTSPATEVTADTITTFLDMYKAGSLERQQLG